MNVTVMLFDIAWLTGMLECRSKRTGVLLASLECCAAATVFCILKM